MTLDAERHEVVGLEGEFWVFPEVLDVMNMKSRAFRSSEAACRTCVSVASKDFYSERQPLFGLEDFSRGHNRLQNLLSRLRSLYTNNPGSSNSWISDNNGRERNHSTRRNACFCGSCLRLRESICVYMRHGKSREVQ